MTGGSGSGYFLRLDRAGVLAVLAGGGTAAGVSLGGGCATPDAPPSE